MDRSVLVRRAVPVAVFAAVLGGIVLVSHRPPDRTSLRPHPLPLAAAGREATDKAMGAAAPALAPYRGKVVVPDSLLAGLPEEGPAYRVGSDVGGVAITRLARALGIDDEVRTDGEGWVAGSGDLTLRVSGTAGLPWYLGADKAVVSSGGGSTGVATAEPATAQPPDAPNASPADGPAGAPAGSPAATGAPDDAVRVAAPPPPSPAPRPSDDVARAVMTRILTALDLDATVTLTPGYAGTDVTAAPVVGGLPTSGFETRVTVGADGNAVYANGFLDSAATVDATYPLLGVRAALDRGYAGGYPGGIEPMLDLAPVPCPSGTVCPTPAAPPDRVATGVRLGLLLSYAYDGARAWLVPAWLLRYADQAWEEPVSALPDAYIETPPPVPTGEGGKDGGVTSGSADPGVPVVETIAPAKP
jgi:hypothetical protein